MEEEAEETVEEEGMPLPNEEGVRLGSCTEEWYTGSAEERGRGRATERGLPSDSLSGLEYRLVWLWMPGPGAGRVGAGAGVDSLDWLTQLSTIPNSGIADSEPKSSAPNWRFRPGTSAEPGISTAVAGIFDDGGILRFWTLSCARCCCGVLPP